MSNKISTDVIQKTPGVGENIAAAYKNVVDSVDAWGLERTTYNYEKPGFAEATGHFTQVVWKGSTYVGCARIDCRKSTLDICLATPPQPFLFQPSCKNKNLGHPPIGIPLLTPKKKPQQTNHPTPNPPLGT